MNGLHRTLRARGAAVAMFSTNRWNELTDGRRAALMAEAQAHSEFQKALAQNA